MTHIGWYVNQTDCDVSMAVVNLFIRKKLLNVSGRYAEIVFS